jgi:hypothetical protein
LGSFPGIHGEIELCTSQYSPPVEDICSSSSRQIGVQDSTDIKCQETMLQGRLGRHSADLPEAVVESLTSIIYLHIPHLLSMRPGGSSTGLTITNLLVIYERY